MYSSSSSNEYFIILNLLKVLHCVLLNPRLWNPTSGIEPLIGTLVKESQGTQTITFRSRKISQPANDDYSQHLSDDEASYHEDASDNVFEMEHYLEYIDNDVWKVIQNGNSKKRISTRKDGVVRILPPLFVPEIHAIEKERKARTILLMAIPKEHLRRFHEMDDAKEIWEP
ncbi:hypothetical protein Tco_0505878 [Tanacetum coccineum]